MIEYYVAQSGCIQHKARLGEVIPCTEDMRYMTNKTLRGHSVTNVREVHVIITVMTWRVLWHETRGHMTVFGTSTKREGVCQSTHNTRKQTKVGGHILTDNTRYMTSKMLGGHSVTNIREAHAIITVMTWRVLWHETRGHSVRKGSANGTWLVPQKCGFH